MNGVFMDFLGKIIINTVVKSTDEVVPIEVFKRI